MCEQESEQMKEYTNRIAFGQSRRDEKLAVGMCLCCIYVEYFLFTILHERRLRQLDGVLVTS